LPTLEEIQQKIKNKANLADLKQIQSQESKAIGIDKSREIIKFAQNKPLTGDQRLVVVFDANKLTEEAQNALLKTLEEHPSYLDIVLVAKNETDLLGTVLSRCKQLRVDGVKSKKNIKTQKKQKSVEELKKLKIGEVVGFAQKIAKMEKDEIIALLESWAIEEENQGFYKSADTLLSSARELEQLNVNARLTLEVCFLTLHTNG